MADERLLPKSVSDESGQAFNELIDRLGAIDITPLLVYIIDNVSSTALPHLAEQFHVMGWEGWQAATTEKEKRELIRRAIELHRKKGTPWAVKEAIKAVGYMDVELEEGLPAVKYDGNTVYGGHDDYGGGMRWALFRAIIDLGEDKGLTADSLARLRNMIDAWKNARSHLDSINFKTTLTDEIPLNEAMSMSVDWTGEDIYPHNVRYDGSIIHNNATRRLYDGSLVYGSQANHSGWIVTGTRYDNLWDVYALKMTLKNEDIVRVIPKYDGAFPSNGMIVYGADCSSVLDPPMYLTVTKHYHYDGRYHYRGDLHNGVQRYNGSRSYFEGISHHGDITATMTA